MSRKTCSIRRPPKHCMTPSNDRKPDALLSNKIVVFSQVGFSAFRFVRFRVAQGCNAGFGYWWYETKHALWLTPATPTHLIPNVRVHIFT